MAYRIAPRRMRLPVGDGDILVYRRHVSNVTGDRVIGEIRAAADTDPEETEGGLKAMSERMLRVAQICAEFLASCVEEVHNLTDEEGNPVGYPKGKAARRKWWLETFDAQDLSGMAHSAAFGGMSAEKKPQASTDSPSC